MAPVISADGLREGTADALRAKRSLAAYGTGWGMIFLGAVLGDGDAHGVTIMAIGGALIAAALLIPLAVSISVRIAMRVWGLDQPTDPEVVAAVIDLRARIEERERRERELSGEVALQGKVVARMLGAARQMIGDG